MHTRKHRHTAARRGAGSPSYSHICGQQVPLRDRWKRAFPQGRAGSNLLSLWPVFSSQWKFLGRVQSWSWLGLPPGSVQHGLQSPGPRPGEGPQPLSGKRGNGASGPHSRPGLRSSWLITESAFLLNDAFLSTLSCSQTGPPLPGSSALLLSLSPYPLLGPPFPSAIRATQFFGSCVLSFILHLTQSPFSHWISNYNSNLFS